MGGPSCSGRRRLAFLACGAGSVPAALWALAEAPMEGPPLLPAQRDLAKACPATAWLVLGLNGASNVRDVDTFPSSILGSRSSGTVVCGRRRGNWVVLDGERGYMKRSFFGRDLLARVGGPGRDDAEVRPAPAARRAPRPERRDATSKCELMVGWSLPELVAAGFGWTFSSLQHILAYAQQECSVQVSNESAEEWIRFGLAPFWTVAVSQSTWDGRWIQLQGGNGDCPKDVHGLYREFYRCRPTEMFDDRRVARFWQDQTAHGDLTLGDMYLQSFASKLLVSAPPFPAEYAAIHVRHGDKILDHTRLLSLGSLMAALRGRWPDIRHVFVATDDEDVISNRSLQAYRDAGYSFSWTLQARWPGGAPNTRGQGTWYHHAKDNASVTSVLDDVLGLARANVLLGGRNSNFFQVAMSMNMQLRASLADQRVPWCWDGTKEAFCDAG